VEIVGAMVLAALLWTHVPSEGRILSVNSLDAKEIEEAASLSTASQTIDAARTLAYDAARHKFAICEGSKKELRRL